MYRHKVVGLAGAVVVAIASVILVSQHVLARPSPRLIWPGEGSAYAAPFDMKANTPYTFSGMSLCLDRPGVVTIERVALVHSYGAMHIDGFGARPIKFGGEGAPAKTLQQIGFPVGKQEVRVPCNVSRLGVEFAVQVSKPTPATTGARGFLVTYRSAHGERTTIVPFGVTLCAPGDRSTGDCGPHHTSQ